MSVSGARMAKAYPYAAAYKHISRRSLSVGLYVCIFFTTGRAHMGCRRFYKGMRLFPKQVVDCLFKLDVVILDSLLGGLIHCDVGLKLLVFEIVTLEVFDRDFG